MSVPRFRSTLVLAIAALLGACNSPMPPMAPAQPFPAPALSQPAPVPAVVGPARAPMTVTCNLPRSGDRFVGTCEVPCPVNALAVDFDGVNARRDCAAPPRTVSATLAPVATAPGRWLGTMTGVQPEDPTRLEIVPNKGGSGSVARMPYGWFAVMALEEEPAGLYLRVDASRQVRPTPDDLAIIDRAIALIPSPEAWNKNDDRQCPPGQAKTSLFCALMQATTEVSGGVHYRQPAMQAVREELNRVDASRIKTHRIMDFNNHPDTTLQEVRALLQAARTRVARDMR